MCQSCLEIDQRIDLHRELLRSTKDPAEIERIKRLIAELHGDRLRLHKNPESSANLFIFVRCHHSATMTAPSLAGLWLLRRKNWGAG
jgi:hypothetical protein